MGYSQDQYSLVEMLAMEEFHCQLVGEVKPTFPIGLFWSGAVYIVYEEEEGM